MSVRHVCLVVSAVLMRAKIGKGALNLTRNLITAIIYCMYCACQAYKANVDVFEKSIREGTRISAIADGQNDTLFESCTRNIHIQQVNCITWTTKWWIYATFTYDAGDNNDRDAQLL